MKKLLFGLLLSISSFTFCSEQEVKRAREDNPIILKTVGDEEITATENLLDQSETIQSMWADIGYKDTIIRLPYKYCTKKTIAKLNKFPFCESKHYDKLTLSRIIKCYLVASYLQIKNYRTFLPLIVNKFEASQDIAEKIKAQKIAYQDNILTSYLKQKWGVFYKKINTFPNTFYYSFSFDNKYAIANNDKEGAILNIKKGSITQFNGMKIFYRNPVVNSDSTLISSCGVSNNDTINIWNIKTGNIITKLPKNIDVIHDIHFLPCNNLFCSFSSDDIIKIWNIKTKQCIQQYKIGTFPQITTHPTENIIIHTQNHSTELHAINITSESTATVDLKFMVHHLKFSPDGNFIAANNYNFDSNICIVAIIDTSSFKEKNRITIENTNTGVTFCYVNSNTIALSYQKTDHTSVTSLWDIKENKIIESTNFFLENICFCSPYLYGVDFATKRHLFLDAITLEPVPFSIIGLNNIESISISNDKNYILSRLNNTVMLHKKIPPEKGESLLELLGRWKERNKK